MAPVGHRGSFLSAGIPLSICLLLILAQPVDACPICDTGAGREVREGLAESNLSTLLTGILSPFAVTGLIAWFMHHARLKQPH